MMVKNSLELMENNIKHGYLMPTYFCSARACACFDYTLTTLLPESSFNGYTTIKYMDR